jgi:hypothetical protein
MRAGLTNNPDALIDIKLAFTVDQDIYPTRKCTG